MRNAAHQKEAADDREKTSPAIVGGRSSAGRASSPGEITVRRQGRGAALAFPFIDSSLDEAGPIIDRPKAEGATT
jgi:hypothetical protein